MDGGASQKPFSFYASAKVTQFGTTPTVDWVTGNATDAWNDGQAKPRVKVATRSIVYLRGSNQFIVFDRLESANSSVSRQWEWNLHSQAAFTVLSPTEGTPNFSCSS